MLVGIFQPALVSGLHSACGTALHILCHKDRSSEVSPNACQRPLLTELHVVCVGVCVCLGSFGTCSWLAMGTPGLPQLG